MEILKQYTIPYNSLGTGVHHFDFKIDDRFFEAFEGTEILSGDLRVKVDVEKHPQKWVLDLDIEGTVGVACDRCLEEVEFPVDYQARVEAKPLLEGEVEDDDEVIWFDPTENEIPLGQYIYESICLELPYQRIHPEDENGHSNCNEDMLQRFTIPTDDSEEEQEEEE